MSIPAAPPVGPVGTPGSWAHHEWISAAVASVDAGLIAGSEQSGWVAPNGDWFRPYAAPFAEGIWAHRIGRMVTLSGMWQQYTGSTFPNAGVMGVMPSWARDSLTHIVLGLGNSNVPQRVDIEKDTGALILRTPSGLVAGAYISLYGSYLLETP